MRIVLALAGATLFAGCASFSGLGGQYQSTETVELRQRPANFYDDVVATGQQLGYQHAGGDRGKNVVMLADQPNFGESVIGRAYTVQITASLKPDGRTVELLYTAFGGRSTAGADKSQQRLEQLKAALRQRLGG